MGKEKISKTEKKPMRDVSEESTARSLTSDLAKSGIEVSKKTITRSATLQPLDCKVADQKNLIDTLKSAQCMLRTSWRKDYAYWKHTNA